MDTNLLQEISADMQRKATTAQVELIEKAMLLEAPEVATLGFDGYKHMLAIDTEGPNMQMVMLYREAGQPYQPLVLLLTDMRMPTEFTNSVRVGLTVTPVLGGRGWAEFQAQRARNNVRD